MSSEETGLVPPKIQPNEHVTVIDRMGLQGDGLSRDGLYVSLSLPGEQVRVLKNGDRGEIIDILKPSPARIKPACAHFGACGGCILQHWAFAPYGAFKRDMTEAVLRRGGLDITLDPILMTPPGTRRRVGLHTRYVKGRVYLGFKARRSWDQVNITECAVSDPAIIAALGDLAELAKSLFEHKKSAPVLHVTKTETGLDIDISGVERKSSQGLSADARINIAIVAEKANFARVSLGGDELLYLSRPPRVRFGKAMVDLPMGAFLQASAVSEADMVGLVRECVAGSMRIADLFCGAGTFALPLAENAAVTAMDSSASAIAALKSASGSTVGLKSVTAEARDLFRRPMTSAELNEFDAVVFDPPRAGCEAQAHEIAASKIKKAVGVSCNPQTFGRDARILMDAGYHLTRVVPIDQFLWSNHIELVAFFQR